jgi:anti-sigma B factor antagonist
MTTPLAVTPTLDPNGRPTLAVAGEVDMSNADQLAAAVDDALAIDTAPLLVDLAELTYVDSAGLRVLLKRAEKIELIANPMLLPVLTICGLTQLTTVKEADSRT